MQGATHGSKAYCVSYTTSPQHWLVAAALGPVWGSGGWSQVEVLFWGGRAVTLGWGEYRPGTARLPVYVPYC
jgi:hypothetical protein